MDTSRLWSSMDFRTRLEREGIDEIETHVEILRIWLERSGNQPLRIRLSYDCQQKDEDLIVERMVVLLLQQVSRWQELEIELPLHFVRRILYAVGSATPLLTHLRILADPSNQNVDVPQALEFFRIDVENADRLEIIRFATADDDLVGSNIFPLHIMSLPASLQILDLDCGEDCLLVLREKRTSVCGEDEFDLPA